MDVSFPTQLYIDGTFVNGTSGRKLQSLDPKNESLICEVECASREDVDRACKAAHRAFTVRTINYKYIYFLLCQNQDGEWGKINARDRGALLARLADLMEEHQEELATIESIDSGAVYTLALKTHIGMSIATWRYFAGWCDKIEGSTIPINNARPNK